jgi:hypothetical protein
VGGALYSALEQNIFVKGSLLIATRDLWDEELFVDHTLNPFADDAGWVPPWARARTPLIYVDDELAAVPGIGVAQAFAPAPGEASWALQWEAHDV